MQWSVIFFFCDDIISQFYHIPLWDTTDKHFRGFGPMLDYKYSSVMRGLNRTAVTRVTISEISFFLTHELMLVTTCILRADHEKSNLRRRKPK